MTPCNGRFPTLVLLMTLLVGSGGAVAPLGRAAMLTALLVCSVLVTLTVVRILRKTLLRGKEGGFILELPPFRRPRIGQILLRSLPDRTGKVLARAVLAAAPAGALIWCLGEVRVAGQPLLGALSRLLDGPAGWMGLPGSLLLAFFLSFPANELLLPLWIGILQAGAAAAAEAALPSLLAEAGMGPRMALCALLFTLFHWPCATTLLTIRRETGSRKWTLFALVLPAAVGFLLSAAANLLWGILQ